MRRVLLIGRLFAQNQRHVTKARVYACIHNITTFEIVSGTATPTLHIFVPYSAHEPRVIMKVIMAKDDFLSVAYTVEVMLSIIKHAYSN